MDEPSGRDWVARLALSLTHDPETDHVLPGGVAQVTPKRRKTSFDFCRGACVSARRATTGAIMQAVSCATMLAAGTRLSLLTLLVAIAPSTTQRPETSDRRQARSGGLSHTDATGRRSGNGTTAAAAPRSQHSFLFMGGLQRSGTTWLEGLVTSPRLSSLSFDNVNPGDYQRQRPWQLQNHTQGYFEMVVRFGGVEGKFVQGVYPYVYFVRDVGKDGKHLDSELLDAKAATPDTGDQLYAQWSLFWDTSRALLLEKTPENFLMGPFLQAAFGSSSTHFAYVMRHPLVWALAIEKWIFPDFVALRTVEERVAFWFECMLRMVEQLPQLHDAVVLQLETASASAEMQLAVARHLLCSEAAADRSASEQTRLHRPDSFGIESKAILASSLGYVTCWLGGMEFKASQRRCVARKAFHDPAYRLQPSRLAAENAWRLKRIARQREAQANQFGYSFEPYLALLQPARSVSLMRARIRPDALPSEQAAQLGVMGNSSTVRAELRPFLAVLPSASSSAAAAPLQSTSSRTDSKPKGQHIVVVFHKMGSDREKPTGMDIRMTQIVQSLVALRYTVHFLCHEEVHESQLSPFDANVVIYVGSLREQFEQAAAAAPVRSVLLFFTTLTMTVHQRMIEGDASWYEEPSEPLPEEAFLSWLRDKAGAAPCVIAVADDIHYLRAVEVMGRHDPDKARAASAWIRRRELAFHAAVDGVATVSTEDAAVLQRALSEGNAVPKASNDKCKSTCGCAITWVPYIQMLKPHAEPFESRHDGMLYVGGMHGLALVAIQWLVQKVQPLIAKQAGQGAVTLLQGSKGHLHLAGPGWAQHVDDNMVLNASVAAGYVTILGTLTDEQLVQRLQEHRVFVAPVFNGTGIATKNVLAMAHGIPLVTTAVGLNGLGLQPGQRAVLATDEPAIFAQDVLEVQTSATLFEATRQAALRHTRDTLSAERQRAALCSLVGCNPASAAVSGGAIVHQDQQLCSTASADTQTLTRASDIFRASVSEPTAPGTPPVGLKHSAPMLALAAHGDEGGATLLGKLVSATCRTHLNPLRGSRCAFPEGYDGCDPDEADLCFHRQGRFSAGRYVERGYRFVHLVRSPLDMLTRSYQLAWPNATRQLNSSQLVSGLEAHWKLLSSNLLHEMMDVAQGFEADPRALRIRLEDLTSETQGNATLAHMLAFLLDRSRADRLIIALTSELSYALSTHARAEMQGDTQRKHLAKLLLHKPAKCHHMNKLLSAVGYEEVACTEPKPSAAGDAKSDSGSAAYKASRSLRRLYELTRASTSRGARH